MIKYQLLLLALFSSFSAISLANDARVIMEKVDHRERTVSDSMLNKSRLSSCKFGKKPSNTKQANITCIETPRVKVLESVSKQLGNNKKDSQSVSILLEPASERGIGMLTFSYDDVSRDTESWLYLSALGKVKRMASGTGEDREPTALFGSEFTTEDMESGKTDEYDYQILQEGPYAGSDVWVIEAKPTPARLKKTNYSKILFWIDKERFIALKLQTFDKQGNPFKRIIFKDIQQINGLWLARDVTVMNLKTQRLSNMKTSEIALDIDIEQEFLTQRTLTDLAYREKELNKLRSLLK